jgi:hypothetical protein
LIVLDKELNKFIGPLWETEWPKLVPSSRYDKSLYESIAERRDQLYNQKCEVKTVGIQNCKADHEASKAFMKAIIDKNQVEFMKYLLIFNRGVDAFKDISRSLLLVSWVIVVITNLIND